MNERTRRAKHALPGQTRRVEAAPSGSPDAHVWPSQGAQGIGAWEPGHRSVEVAVLTFRGWRVCARCYRNKKNMRVTLCSGSELVSVCDLILHLVACRPRARVIRACAVGIARRGAQIGRLGAPCKAGGLGDHHMDGRDVAVRHISGPSAVPSAAQPRVSKRDGSPAVREPRRMRTRAEHNLEAHRSCEQAGPVGWDELVTCDEQSSPLNPAMRNFLSR